MIFEGDRATGIEVRRRGREPNGRVRRRPFQAPRPAGGRAGGWRLRDAGAPAALRLPLAERPAGPNLRIHPACWVGARFAEEVRGWDGVMQSYAVDEWEDRGLLLEATFTPLAFGAQWLPGTGVEHSRAGARLRPGRLHRRPPLGSVGRAVGLSRDGSLRITYRLTGEDARQAHLRDRPRGRAVLRRRRPRGLSADRRDPDAPEATGSPTSTPRRPPPRRCASRRSTRWARAEWTPTPRSGVVGTDGAVHGAEGLYVADGSLLPELDRRQPDDDHHRDGARVARRLADRVNSETAARRRPSLNLVRPGSRSLPRPSDAAAGADGGVAEAAGPAGGPIAQASRSPGSPNEVPSSCIASQPP